MIIVKIGGGASLNLPGIAADLAAVGEPVIVVHGANVLRDEVARKMGFKKQVLTSISGFSSVFSDEDALDAILMAYSGLRNKRLVELCRRAGFNAIGLTGLDGALVQGRRNRGIRVMENGKKRLRRDFSGKPETVNVKLLNLLLAHGYRPVITIPLVDENGFAINAENDDVVAALQAATGADTVLQLIEAPGFLDDPEDPASVLARLPVAELPYRIRTAEGRMKRKLYALDKLVQGGTNRIILADGRTEHPVRDALAGAGTVVR